MSKNLTVTNVPDIDLDRGFRWWHIDEIYKGNLQDDPRARYVPNVNDAVIDWSGGTFSPFYVSYVNPDTYISTLKPAEQVKKPDEVDMENVLVGQGVGAVNEAYRCYLNTATVPFTLQVSSLLHLYGSDIAYCKIFRGSDVTENGEVISKNYDQSGHYQGDNIPMELVATVAADGTNKYIYCVKAGYCSIEMKDGERLTAVIYSDAGIVCSTAILIVQNTLLVRDSNAPKREITGITLVSDFLSPHDKNVLEIPLNLPVNSIMANARLEYNDGTGKDVLIDGSKCLLSGLNAYISSVPGMSYPVTLSYFLSRNESCSIAAYGESPHIDRPYRIVTKNPDRTNAVKLFGVPQFQNEVLGWKVNYFLQDLERSAPIDVTQHVTYHKSTPFNGVDYGKVQKLQLVIDLKSLGGNFMDFRFVQDFDIMLRGKPDGVNDAFWIQYEEGTGWYGEGTAAWSATVDGRSNLDICQNLHFEDEWVDMMYRKVCPMPDLQAGVVAPRPTHVKLTFGNNSRTIEVAKFKDIISWPVLLRTGDVLRLDWLARTASNELNLATTPLMVKAR